MKFFCARNEIIEDNEGMLPYILEFVNTVCKGKGKAVSLQARKGPEGSRKLRFPDFVTTAQDGSRLLALTLPTGNAPGSHFC